MLALISSDVLKLRRRRGMLAISLLLTAGLMLVAFVVMAIQHGGNPARYGPAGGLANYQDDIGVVTLMALIVGTIIGATAGTKDIESGVFRDLAATGRSRMALFASRVAGAWAVILPILAVTAALAPPAASRSPARWPLPAPAPSSPGRPPCSSPARSAPPSPSASPRSSARADR